MHHSVWCSALPNIWIGPYLKYHDGNRRFRGIHGVQGKSIGRSNLSGPLQQLIDDMFTKPSYQSGVRGGEKGETKELLDHLLLFLDL